MKFKYDHDLHLHSCLSLCSEDPEHTNERILQYAEDNGFHTICLTNHFWDEKVEGCGGYGYEIQNFEWIKKALPLPQSDKVHFLFGCETELSKDMVLGLSKERMDEFDFIVIPINHLHFRNFTLDEKDDTAKGRADAWVNRFDAVLNMDLPFHKIGIAHLSRNPVKFMWAENPDYTNEDILRNISNEDMYRLFSKAASLGVGIELNAHHFRIEEDIAEENMRMYKIAKECGCKFYCGSDAHKVCEQDIIKYFENTQKWLDLDENDKYDVKKLWRK